MRWISDPGHAWLEVPIEDVLASGYTPTHYSYRWLGMAYLEEDVDGPGYLAAIGYDRDRDGVIPTMLINKFPGRGRYERFPEVEGAGRTR